jgi:HEAT repeats
MLFLTKSTAKTLRRINIQRLGGGTLLGGRGLPKDLTSMTVAGGRVVSRPMNGAIEGMLTVLEDPRAEQADAAAAGLVDRYYREGPSALRPYKVRFRKMLTDRDPGVRRVAAWALAHTGDMDIVPSLIDTLTDPDEDVVDAARLGLQIISRKLEGLGPPTPSTPEQRKEAAARWRDWYAAIKPLDLDDENNPAGPGSVRAGTGTVPDGASPPQTTSPSPAGNHGSPRP